MTQPAAERIVDITESAGAALAANHSFEECFDSTSCPRAHWQSLVTSLQRLGEQELQVRFENGQRLLKEHGVSCFVPNGKSGTDQPWQLDLLPLIISEQEWQALEAGLAQRARLLNLVLGDLYGTQRLVRDGFVPAPLVYANPNYLRACQAIGVRDGAYLQLYAADLGRSPDGQWWVIADRTQAPAGVGFALENRSVLARVLPEAMREVQPRPVSDFLRQQLRILQRLAPDQTGDPSVVLLTPGQRNQAYFEHAYLSRLLGLTLVEGADLTVRDRGLFIKTLNGLRRVDVVQRRLADSYCDPLELDPESVLGAPGLVEAARAGTVSLANALGSGLLEAPGFMPFLPALCRQLLGSELLLPSLASWWCGQAKEHSYVTEHLDNLAIRSAMSLAGKSVKPDRLDAVQRAKLFERVRLCPHEFVGQEELQLSRAPVWKASGPWDSRPFVLRVFVIYDGDEFKVMPGGLAWIQEEDLISSGPVALTSLSKDVWVLSPDSISSAELHLNPAAISGDRQTGFDLPSRTADNFFWLARYTERLEQSVRMARQGLSLLEEEITRASRGRFAAMERLLASLGLTKPCTDSDDNWQRLEQELLSFVFDQDRPDGVRELFERIHQTAFSVRDRLSADTWRLFNRLNSGDPHRTAPPLPVQAVSQLHSLILDLAALSGMEMENMTRGYGWVFLDLGRRIERGIFMARLTAALLAAGEASQILLEPALEIADSVMTHRRYYFWEPHVSSVLELLVKDRRNPRSVAFQLAAIKGHAAILPLGIHEPGVVRINQSTVAIDRQLSSVAPQDPEEAASKLTDLADALGEFSQLITEVYFSHVSPRVN